METWISLILIYVAAYLLGYSLPSIIAHGRCHIYAWPITVINILFGWTLIGYCISLVWAVWPRNRALLGFILFPSGKAKDDLFVG